LGFAFLLIDNHYNYFHWFYRFHFYNWEKKNYIKKWLNIKKEKLEKGEATKLNLRASLCKIFSMLSAPMSARHTFTFIFSFFWHIFVKFVTNQIFFLLYLHVAIIMTGNIIYYFIYLRHITSLKLFLVITYCIACFGEKLKGNHWLLISTNTLFAILKQCLCLYQKKKTMLMLFFV
jgi:hypothetical protein